MLFFRPASNAIPFEHLPLPRPTPQPTTMPPCGIIAYSGSKHNVVDTLIDGLQRLEYRGYDSAGVGLTQDGNDEIVRLRAVGKVNNLKQLTNSVREDPVMSGVAHTRWATHGAPSVVNCHPHANKSGSLCLVHNGIVENYESLRTQLQTRGFVFKSQTDTEVMAHLIDDILTTYPKIDLMEAVRLCLTQIEGTFGIAVVHTRFPGVLVGARRGSPLIVGVAKDEYFLCSDAAAIIDHTSDVIYLQDNQIVSLKPGMDVHVVSIENEKMPSKIVTLAMERTEIEKGGYKHFMIKEIHDQPRVMRECLRGRVVADSPDVRLGAWNDVEMAAELKTCERFILCACGTSWHAAMVGEYLIEDLCRVPVEVEYASEFRYRNPILRPGKDIVMAISQSGETADTLAAIGLAKEAGCKTFGFVNTVGSTIARDVDCGIYLRAGPEIGVASTKAFTAQVLTLVLFAVKVGRERGVLDEAKALKVLGALQEVPDQITGVLKAVVDDIQMASRVFRYASNFLYLGRGYNFPVALEGALKLKEISYIHAEGYPAAEMKHGPIALIDVFMPVVFIAPKRDSSYGKVKSNIEEVIARKGTIIIITDEGNTDFDDRAEFVFKIPLTVECLYPLLTVVPLQLMSYFIADLRGIDVDRPRNLAKSVTVE